MTPLSANCVCVCVCVCVSACGHMYACAYLPTFTPARTPHGMSVCLSVSHNKTVCQLRCPMCTGKMCTYIISLIQIFLFFQIAIKYDNNEIIFASRGCVVNATCLSDGVEQCTDTGPSQVILVE